MKKLILITILFTSCSVFRHKTEHSSSRKELLVHAQRQKDSLRLSATQQRVHFLSDDQLELTEIIPQGVFVYKPDSGFIGKAAKVQVYRRHQQQSFKKDSSVLGLTAKRDKTGVDSILHEQNRRHFEETKESKPVSGWRYMVGVVGLLLIILAISFGWKKIS